MRRLPLFLLVIVVTVSLAGCRAKEAIDNVKIAKDLKKQGTIDLLEKTSKDQYNPPADGRLTDAQIQMYLKVREREMQIAEVAKKELQQHAEKAKKNEEDKNPLRAAMATMKGLGSVADLATADIRAAADLGFNTAEYSWVKGQILEASTAEMTERMANATNQMADAAYAQMKQQYESATDENMKNMLGEMLKGYDEQRAQNQMNNSIDPSVAYNRQLLSKYENTLNAVAQEWTKFGLDGQTGQQKLKDGIEQYEQAARDAAAGK
jgi:hypothetical protein